MKFFLTFVVTGLGISNNVFCWVRKKGKNLIHFNYICLVVSYFLFIPFASVKYVYSYVDEKWRHFDHKRSGSGDQETQTVGD